MLSERLVSAGCSTVGAAEQDGRAGVHSAAARRSWTTPLGTSDGAALWGWCGTSICRCSRRESGVRGEGRSMIGEFGAGLSGLGR